MNLSNDDLYLVKLKGCGLSTGTIATRLNISAVEVEKRWKRIQEGTLAAQENGHTQLCQQYTVLCHQYQLLGESLKIISHAISDELNPEELSLLIVDDKTQTLDNLRRNAIILRPFKPVDPAESLKERLEKQAESN